MRYLQSRRWHDLKTIFQVMGKPISVGSGNLPQWRRWLRTGGWCLLCWCSTRPPVSLANSITLADHATQPFIVAPSPIPDQIAYAVTDLRHYLQQMTGAEVMLLAAGSTEQPTMAGLPIYVGAVKANMDLLEVVENKGLGPDGFVLEVSDQAVRILGGSPFGSANGVYNLLERLGVRWFFPGKWGEVVPDPGRLFLDAGRYTARPAFEKRRISLARSPGSAGEWMRRQGHRYTGFGGHSSLMHPRRHHQDHPEWYAEIKGERVFQRPGTSRFGHDFKLCHSNPEMVAEAVREVRQGLLNRRDGDGVRNHRGFRIAEPDLLLEYSISPTDGGGFCHCENCQAMGSVSDRLQFFANALATAIKHDFPGTNLSYYGAYSAHQEPPTIKSQSNVRIHLTTWTRDFFKTLFEGHRNQAFRQKVEGFAEISENLSIRDYDGMFSQWWGFGPISLIEPHVVDYRWYHELGVKGISTEASGHWAAAGQSYYISSRLWWDPWADVEALKRDFVEKAFAGAVAPMWEYHERLNRERGFLTSSSLLALRQYLETAAARPDLRADVQRRIDYMRLYHLIFDIYRRYLAGSADRDSLYTASRIGLALIVDEVVSPALVNRLVAALRQADPGIAEDRLEPFSPGELSAVLGSMTLPPAQAELPAWRDRDDLTLVPLDREEAEFELDMGVNFRYGPATLLIKVVEGELIDIAYSGRRRADSVGRYELFGPEMNLVAEGTISAAEPLRVRAGSSGVHTLKFTAGGAWSRLRIANRWAVIKASSTELHLHPIHASHAFFHVPEGVREFAFVARADPNEPYGLILWGPHDASQPLVPEGGFTWRNAYIRSGSTTFEEHRIEVPEGADGKVWRYLLHGEDKKIFFQGIPPFLAADPVRLLIPPPEVITNP